MGKSMREVAERSAILPNPHDLTDLMMMVAVMMTVVVIPSADTIAAQTAKLILHLECALPAQYAKEAAERKSPMKTVKRKF